MTSLKQSDVESQLSRFISRGQSTDPASKDHEPRSRSRANRSVDRFHRGCAYRQKAERLHGDKCGTKASCLTHAPQEIASRNPHPLVPSFAFGCSRGCLNPVEFRRRVKLCSGIKIS